MTDLLHLTLLELRDVLAGKEASPVDLMKAVLERADATHGRLNALICRRDPDELMADARVAEERIMRGQGRPLEGIPFGVKDLEDAAGLITSHGSILFRDNLVESDSIQVERLRRAGAIVVGKTSAPEFGHTAITRNLVHGVTRSPWGTDRTPGGSSGGSAALLAAEVLPLVTASDGGGSIRIPASFCGAFGLKPSFGRVPRGPARLWDYGKTAVYGPITKTVSDAAFILDQVVGAHPLDVTSLPHPGHSYLDQLERSGPEKLRLAFSPDLGYAVVQSDVAAVVDTATRVFADLGHTVESITGGPPEMGADWGLLTAYELGAEISDLLPERAGDITRALLRVIELARGITPQWWREAARRRALVVAWAAGVFSEYDALITPTMPYDPPAARGPLPTEIEGRRQPTASAGSFTIPFNLSWHPAATVRAGLSESGLPVGLQIVGPHHRDDLVLTLARQFEQARPWHPQWPLR